MYFIMKNIIKHITSYGILLLCIISILSCTKKEKDTIIASLENATVPSLLALLNATPMSVKAPALPLPDLSNQNNTISINDFQNSLLVLSVWRSGCAWCQEEGPLLSKLAALAENDSTITLFGISQDYEESEALDFIKKYKLTTYPHAIDKGGEKRKSTNILEISGTPTTFIISPQGRVLGRIEGYHKFKPQTQYMILQKLYELTK